MKTFWIGAVILATACVIGWKAVIIGSKQSSAVASPAVVEDVASVGPGSSQDVPRSPAQAADQAAMPAGTPAEGIPVEARSIGEVTSQVLLPQLSGIMALGDVIQDHPGLDDESIIRLAMEQSGLPRETIEILLAGYPKVSATSLAEHYRNVLAKPELKAVASAMQAAGIRDGLNVNLLSEGLRLCSLRTLHGDFLTSLAEDFRRSPDGVDPIPEMLEEASRLDGERAESLGAIETFFRDRFIRRHGIKPTAVTGLLDALRGVRVASAMAEELHPPRVIRP